MRQEQFERLQTLSDKLTEVFIDEATPENWPGNQIPLSNMDQQTRGDRYWCKKNAAATLAIVARISNLTNAIRLQGGNLPPAAGDGEDESVSTLDKDISNAEKEASRLLDKVQKAASKREFDNRVHGKSKG